LARDSHEQIVPLEENFPIYGEKTETVSRYLACYSKLDSAKYFSHTDVNNIIQRSFRRAGIPVCFTKGFHPKMIVSYPPALPMGMEGKAEVIEFRSDYDIPLDEFASHINAYLPPGVRFLCLERLKSTDHSLIERIQSFVYSVDLNADQVIETLQNSQKGNMDVGLDIVQHVDDLVDSALRENGKGGQIDFSVDRNKHKLLLDIKFNKNKLVRPQDIVSEIIGITNPVYCMAREKIVFKAS
jgi:radical SAM-linked protein